MNKVKQISRRVIPQFRRSLQGNSRQQRIARLSIMGITAALLIGSLFPLLNIKPTSAAIFTQDDWSGGIGTNPENQYDSASNMDVDGGGHLQGGAALNTDWCDTINCNTAWDVRKPIALNNPLNSPGSSLTADSTLRLEVKKDDGMQDDFDDLRFTNTAGDQDLVHYILHKTDGESATVLVLLPANTLLSGISSIYMYYLNDSATSVSNERDVMGAEGYSKSDDGNGTLSSRWESDYAGAPITQTSEGKVQLALGGELDYFNYNNNVSFIGGQPRTMELSFSRNPAIIPVDACGQNVKDNITTHDGLTGISMYYGCDEEGSFWSPDGVKKLGGETILNRETSPKFRTGGEAWFRIEYKADQLVEIYYSQDGGKTYQAFEGSSGAGQGPNMRLSMFVIGPATITIGDMIVYSPPANVTTRFGANQYKDGHYAELNSVPINLGSKYELGDLSYNFTGGGAAFVKIRTGNDSAMNGAIDFAMCPLFALGPGETANANNTCTNTNQQYLQYQVILTTDANPNTFTDISIEYLADNDGPITNASNFVTTVPERDGWPSHQVDPGGWVFDSSNTEISWDAAEDDAGGSGIKGYCLYLGGDPTGDPQTASGDIYSPSPLDTDGVCNYAIAGTSFTFADIGISPYTRPEPYYVNIKAIDNFNNLYEGMAATTSFGFDSQPPNGSTLFSAPQGYTNSKTFTIDWIAGFPFGLPEDNESGVAGMKYCITNSTLGFSDCFDSGENYWYGAAHSSGNIHDISDVLDFNTAKYTTRPSDFARIDENGTNLLVFALVDNAGNTQVIGQAAVLLSQAAPSIPTNLQVNPTSSNQNNFSFTWQPPATLVGPASQVDYCWTVNEAINSNGSNCNWTGKGITQLAAGAYATQQGVNTLRLIAKNQAGNFNASFSASVNFTTNTPAPGPPQNVDIADVSTRATSAWKLALSWNAPNQAGAGISQYKIYRSIDNQNFAEVGATSPSNTSFIDNGLAQVDYYYHIKACDNANSCSVASSVVTKKPTGRFTSPPHLTTDSDQPKATDISTRRATIVWFTDRESDSRVVYGTKPGQYGPQEIGNSTQITSHTVNLVNLEPGTKYYYQAKWTDQDGNTGQSSERSFVTAPAPEISEVEPTRLSVADASIGFSSQHAAKVRLFYGRSEAFGQVVELNTSLEKSRYNLNLPGLSDNSRYYFKINSFDNEGNEYQGNSYTFTTPARPVITNLRFQPVEGEPSSTQKISWNTNVPANSELVYGPRGETQIETARSELVTNHEVTIANLEDAKIYTLIARSRDAAGNQATSDLQTFQTSLDTRPPKIRDVTVEVSTKNSGDLARGQLIVSWKTDELATSQVTYGPGQTGAYTTKSPADDRLKKEHVVVLGDLGVSSIYHLQVLSKDKAGNEAKSPNRSAIIGRGNDNVFTIIFRSLQQIFGLDS